MRLNKTVVTERENFVRDLFRTSPELTGLEVQGKLKEKFGKIMRPNRIYELKREITNVQVNGEVVQTLGPVTVTLTNGDGLVAPLLTIKPVDTQVSAS